jgi:hypothetical protein
MEDTHALNITHTSTEESRFISDKVHHSFTNNSLVLKQDFEDLEGTNIDIHHIQLRSEMLTMTNRLVPLHDLRNRL